MEMWKTALIILGIFIIAGVIWYFWVMHKIKKLGEAIDAAMPKEETFEEEMTKKD